MIEIAGIAIAIHNPIKQFVNKKQLASLCPSCTPVLSVLVTASHHQKCVTTTRTIAPETGITVTETGITAIETGMIVMSVETKRNTTATRTETTHTKVIALFAMTGINNVVAGVRDVAPVLLSPIPGPATVAL